MSHPNQSFTLTRTTLSGIAAINAEWLENTLVHDDYVSPQHSGWVGTLLPIFSSKKFNISVVTLIRSCLHNQQDKLTVIEAGLLFCLLAMHGLSLRSIVLYSQAVSRCISLLAFFNNILPACLLSTPMLKVVACRDRHCCNQATQVRNLSIYRYLFYADAGHWKMLLYVELNHLMRLWAHFALTP